MKSVRKQYNNKSFAYVRGLVRGVGDTDSIIVYHIAKYFKEAFLVISSSKKLAFSPVKNVKVINIPVKKTRVPFLSGLIFSILAFLRLFTLKNKPSIILWIWSLAFPGAFLYKIFVPFSKVVIDIRTHPIIRECNLYDKLMEALFKLTLSVPLFDGYTIITKSMLAYVRTRYNILKNIDRICIWNSGYDKQLFKIMREKLVKYKRGEIRNWFNLKEQDKALLYYGSLDYARYDMLVTIIDSLKILTKKCYENIKILIVGDGDAKEKLLEYINRNYLEKQVVFLPPVPYPLVPVLLEVADVVVAPYPLNSNWYTQHPLKVIEAIAMLKPIITTPLRELRELLPGELLVASSRGKIDPYELACKIEKLLLIIEKKNDEYIRIIQRLREIREKFSWDVIAQQLYDCLRRKVIRDL